MIETPDEKLLFDLADQMLVNYSGPLKSVDNSLPPMGELDTEQALPIFIPTVWTDLDEEDGEAQWTITTDAGPVYDYEGYIYPWNWYWMFFMEASLACSHLQLLNLPQWEIGEPTIDAKAVSQIEL
jgi:hypothetical protein